LSETSYSGRDSIYGFGISSFIARPWSVKEIKVHFVFYWRYIQYPGQFGFVHEIQIDSHDRTEILSQQLLKSSFKTNSLYIVLYHTVYKSAMKLFFQS
jgi:hypothetical protein